MTADTTGSQPWDIRITDLADPVLTPQIIAARRGPADFPDSLSVEQVLEHASRASGGLSDFGPDDFKERLAVTLRSWGEDSGLTRGGHVTLLQHAIRVMANRLRIEDVMRRYPEILDIKIDRPIIIAGLPSSSAQ